MNERLIFSGKEYEELFQTQISLNPPQNVNKFMTNQAFVSSKSSQTYSTYDSFPTYKCINSDLKPSKTEYSLPSLSLKESPEEIKARKLLVSLQNNFHMTQLTNEDNIMSEIADSDEERECRSKEYRRAEKLDRHNELLNPYHSKFDCSSRVAIDDEDDNCLNRIVEGIDDCIGENHLENELNSSSNVYSKMNIHENTYDLVSLANSVRLSKPMLLEKPSKGGFVDVSDHSISSNVHKKQMESALNIWITSGEYAPIESGHSSPSLIARIQKYLSCNNDKTYTNCRTMGNAIHQTKDAVVASIFSHFRSSAAVDSLSLSTIESMDQTFDLDHLRDVSIVDDHEAKYQNGEQIDDIEINDLLGKIILLRQINRKNALDLPSISPEDGCKSVPRQLDDDKLKDMNQTTGGICKNENKGVDMKMKDSNWSVDAEAFVEFGYSRSPSMHRAVYLENSVRSSMVHSPEVRYSNEENLASKAASDRITQFAAMTRVPHSHCDNHDLVPHSLNNSVYEKVLPNDTRICFNKNTTKAMNDVDEGFSYSELANPQTDIDTCDSRFLDENIEIQGLVIDSSARIIESYLEEDKCSITTSSTTLTELPSVPLSDNCIRINDTPTLLSSGSISSNDSSEPIIAKSTLIDESVPVLTEYLSRDKKRVDNYLIDDTFSNALMTGTKGTSKNDDWLTMKSHSTSSEWSYDSVLLNPYSSNNNAEYSQRKTRSSDNEALSIAEDNSLVSMDTNLSSNVRLPCRYAGQESIDRVGIDKYTLD